MMILARRNAVCLAFITLLAGASSTASAAALAERWHPGDAPPDVEGIHLGDARERVVAVLGQPDAGAAVDDPAADVQSLRFRGGALLIAIEKSSGVTRIMLRKPESGALAGIRVGDRLGAMLVNWGEPTQSHGSVGRYEMGAWTIIVRVDFGEQKVLKLSLARSSNPPQPVAADATPSAGTAQPAP